MRITTRIALGLLLMVGLLVGTLTYQLSVVDQLQGINQELSQTSLEARQIAVHLVQGLDGVREFAAKASALEDEDYLSQWRDWEGAVEGELVRLSEVGLSGREEEARSRIEAGWRGYEEVAAQARGNPEGLLEIEDALADIRDRVGEFMAINEEVVTARVESSAAAGEDARFVAWAAAACALLLAALVSGLLFVSISGPLRHLTRGTRELARGRFDYRLNVEGPAELSYLAQDFNHMAARLDELEDLKRDFISHVSHELKTPLAAIQETVEVLLDRLAGPLTAKQQHLLTLSRRSTDRLSSMITNLLEMSRLEAGATGYDPELHDPVRIVRSVIDEMGPLVRDRGIRIAVETNGGAPAIVCDGARIRDVVANLVGNAVKFSPPDGRVSIEISEYLHAPEGPPAQCEGRPPLDVGPFLLLSIADEGQGVPDEHKEKVFEKFHQVGRREGVRGQQGVGLGLAISRRIVEAHGGRIWVDDTAEGGAVFHMLIPKTPSRWRDSESADFPGQQAPSNGNGRTAAPTARTSAMSILLLIAASVPLAGCAAFTGSRDVATAPVRPLPTIEVSSPPSAQMRLARAQKLLAQGEHAEAAEEFERVLAANADSNEAWETWEEGPPDSAPDALLGLALIYLLPESALHDVEQGKAFLGTLDDRFPETPQAVHGRWVLVILDELADAVEQIESQARVLQDLNETLERLRQIDLERRPSGEPRNPSSPSTPSR